MTKFQIFILWVLSPIAMLTPASAADEGDYYRFDTSLDDDAIDALEQKTASVNSSKAEKSPYVILVSLDGFRHDYIELHGASNLAGMKREGSSVKRLIPAFPSKTFPNHYTIATGMYPSRHGLVGNTFYSREKAAKFSLGNRDVVEDGSWYGGTPLWVLAEQQGMRTACFFWVGSEADVQGIYPSSYFKYNGSVPYNLRIEKAKRWLALPEETRPHLIMLYFSLTDSVGHRFGPESEETGNSVRYVDKLMGELRDYIRASELPINLIVTADHGMSLVSELINVHDFVDIGEAKFVGGPMAMIYTDTASETERIYRALQGQDNFDVYLEGALPDYLNFSNADRIGDIVLVTEAPSQLDYLESGDKTKGGYLATHGFDPFQNEEMGAIFIAEGPGIVPGQRLAPVENVNVYPFVATLLGLEIGEKIDGQEEALDPMLDPSLR